jgi:GNAT superfamily N-acetyltransferase
MVAAPLVKSALLKWHYGVPRPAMPAIIRKLHEDDIDGICELWKEFAKLREGLTKSKILNTDAAYYFFGYATGLLSRKDTLTLVAEDGGKVVGYLIAQKQRRPPIYHHTQVAYLSDSFVATTHRGQGILRRFIDELRAWCKKEAITAIDVQIFEGNKDALAVYRKLGFRDYRVLLRQEVVPAPVDA